MQGGVGPLLQDPPACLILCPLRAQKSCQQCYSGVLRPKLTQPASWLIVDYQKHRIFHNSLMILDIIIIFQLILVKTKQKNKVGHVDKRPSNAKKVTHFAGHVIGDTLHVTCWGGGVDYSLKISAP